MWKSEAKGRAGNDIRKRRRRRGGGVHVCVAFGYSDYSDTDAPPRSCSISHNPMFPASTLSRRNHPSSQHKNSDRGAGDKQSIVPADFAFLSGANVIQLESNQVTCRGRWRGRQENPDLTLNSFLTKWQNSLLPLQVGWIHGLTHTHSEL